MSMDDDEEFGDLYSDVLQPLNLNPAPTLNIAAGDPIPAQNPKPNPSSNHALIDGEPTDNWMPDNWDDDEDGGANSGFPGRTNLKASAADVSEDAKGIGIPGIINGEDWDSDDSEDDLKIVLNDEDDDRELGIGERNEDDDYVNEVCKYNNNNNNVVNDGGLGKEDEDLESKEVNGAARSGLNNYRQQNSLFKYVRSGVAVPGAPLVAPPGQICPPGKTVGSIAGRVRGEWRPGFGPKDFGSGWVNNASRPFGSGLEFTLPSYKTIFEVDIEIFEEKPWRHPGADISDYFNFGLDEDNWREYAKHLDQLRIESTMQSKICVYESGRSEQEYDPDLPPELAAAAGHHDISAENMNSGMIDNERSDMNSQGRGSPYTRASLPAGRPIQVETGNGERRPSMDTRPPRPRAADVIIEIFLHDSEEDTAMRDNELERPEKDVRGGEHKGVDDAEGDRHSASEQHGHLPQNFNGHRRESGSFDHGGRLTGPSHGSCTSTDEKHNGPQKERRENSMEPKQNPELSPAIAAETTKRELSTEQNDDENEDKLAFEDNIDVEDEETSDSIIHSSRNQKLSSLVEPTTVQDNDHNLRNTLSDNSLQDGRLRRDGNLGRHKNDYARETGHEMMDREQIGSRVHESMHHYPYPNRDRELHYPVRPVRDFERMRETEGLFWRERKIRVKEMNDKDGILRNQEGSSRRREKKKDGDHSRRERTEKEELSRCKREKDDKLEDNYRTSKHKDDCWHQRNIDDRLRLKHAHDDRRNRRSIVSEKDNNQIIDKRHYKEREDVHAHAREKKYTDDRRNSKAHNTWSSASHNQKKSKERYRESTKKYKDTEAGIHNSSGLGKRKHDDNTLCRERVSLKVMKEQEKQGGNNLTFNYESNRDSKRGRSKIEHWSTDIKEVDGTANDDIITSTDEMPKTDGNDISDPDRHLDTVEKLRKRSERFKTPLPVEKDATASKRLENNGVQMNQIEAHTCIEVKPERPARKRRWTSS